jgi:predicted adenylyl cyclase CyaB
MPSNIEIKTRVINREAFLTKARGISDMPEKIILQEDVFFRTDKGRLKLRKFSDGTGELIYYERSDIQGPKQCDYSIVHIPEADVLADILIPVLGIRGIVRKNRTLFMCRQTRIHFDEVENLGSFAELEVVLREGQTPEQGESIARRLMTDLGIEKSELIEAAYIDLLEEKDKGRN